jgi:outer membrane protein
MLRFILTLHFAVFASFCFAEQKAEQKKDISLEEALIASYEHNPRLKSERAKLHAADESLSQANANWRPKLRIEGEGGLQSQQQKFPFGSPLPNFQGASFAGGSIKNGIYTMNQNLASRTGKLVAEQPIYRGGRIIAQKNAAFHGILAQRNRLLSVEQDVFLDVILAHLNVVRDQSILNLQQKTENVLARHLEATKARLDVGEVTKTDLAQAEFRLAGAKADRIKAESDLKNAQSNYEKIVGFPPLHLHFPTRRPDLPEKLDQCIEIAEIENPLILASREDETVSRHDVRQVKGELLPNISLRGELLQGNDLYQRHTRNRNAGIFATISIPLYSSGSVEARIRQARHTQNQKGHDIEKIRRDIREKTEQSWDQWVAAKAQIVARKQEVVASGIALEGVINEQKAGSRTLLEVLDAEKEALKAKVNLVQATRDELAAAFSLLPSMGRLTVKALGLQIPEFNTNDHLEKVRSQWFGWGDKRIHEGY